MMEGASGIAGSKAARLSVYGGLMLACFSTRTLGQFLADFEPPAYAGSPAGTLLTGLFPGAGQAGWYVPAQATDGRVFRYDGNALGIVTNPAGGSQFAGPRGDGLFPARAQHDVGFAGGSWTASFDVCLDRFGGVLPSVYNAAFSLQNSAIARSWQAVCRWDGALTGNAAEFGYLFYDATGAAQPVTVPGAAWDLRPLNTWHRLSTTWDFDTNRILSVSIDNLHDPAPPTTMDVSGLGWYLSGGANSNWPLPTAIRLFSGGGPTGWPVAAWDNIVIIPAPGWTALTAAIVVAGAGRRRRTGVVYRA